MKGSVRLSEQDEDPSPNTPTPLPALIPLDREDAARAARRRDLMLDDGMLQGAVFDFRRYVTWRVVLFFVLTVLTGGTLAVVSMWPMCRRRREKAVTSACSAEEAEVAIVDVSAQDRTVLHRHSSSALTPPPFPPPLQSPPQSPDGSHEICPVEEVDVRPLEVLPYFEARARSKARPAASLDLSRRMVVYRHTRFLFRASSRRFVQVESDEFPAVLPLLPNAGGGGGGGGGLSSAEAAARLALVGRNLIDVPIPPVPILLIRECVHPFIVFQIWAVIVWLTEAYWSFSIFILVSALATAVMNLVDVRRNLTDIRRLSLFTTPVGVLRDGAPATVDSSELVPGDLLLLESNMKLPCDAVLVAGSCTVTEAMLTGEATVAVKQPLLPSSSSSSSSSPASSASGLSLPLASAEMRNTVFGGTTVVELRVPRGERVVACVARTGFDTVKGRLVLSILHPSAPHFKFLEQSLRYIGILFACAMVGFAINAKALADAGTSAGKIVQRGCDMITIVVPPALPLAVTVGTMYALVALRRRGIFCISPPRVNLAGKINAFVFDKTGTLTTDCLELAEVRPCEKAVFAPGPAPSLAALCQELVGLLACCHSLTHVGGELAGDPLELETFAFTGATLEEPHTTMGGEGGSAAGGGNGPTIISRVRVAGGQGGRGGGFEGEVVRQFEFVPGLQRMGVLVRTPPDGGGSDSLGPLLSFVKGSPESIAALSDPASLPPDFAAVLAGYTKRGLRVLGCASKRIPASEAARLLALPAEEARAESEAGASFLGFVVLENALKPESAPTIARLRTEAGLLLHMATGDNAVSAVVIARNCGIVEPDVRVFLGDVVVTPASGAGGSPAPTLRVAWRDVDDEARMLDPLTLLPMDGSGGTPYRLALTGRAFNVLQDEAKAAEQADAATVREAFPTTASGGGSGGVGAKGLVAAHPPLTAVVSTVASATSGPRAHLRRAVLNCAVFARMSPENKAALVEELQGAGLYVGMIGDGANDSMALRVAHVGVSLSQVEASVAAPFTYAVPNPSIDVIPALLCEGRGALATSFCLFQFMALYSTIQFANALLIVFAASFLSNNMYLFQDLYVVFLLSVTLGNTPSSTVLTRKRPSGRLFSAHNLLITFGFIGVTFLCQGIAFASVRAQEWYGTPAYPTVTDPALDEEGVNAAIPETSTVFLLASFQYLACAIIFSVGHPWKASPLRNRPFCLWLLVVALSAFGLFLFPTDGLYAFLSLQRMPFAWNLQLLALAVASFLAYFAFMGGLAALKRAGIISRLERRFFRGPTKPHKEVRRAWAAQFAGGGMMGAGASGAGPGAGAAAGPRGDAMRLMRISRARGAAGAAPDPSSSSTMVEPLSPVDFSAITPPAVSR